MKENKYLIWTDGVLTSMATLVNSNLDGTYTVKNPVNIVFATEQVPVEGDPTKVKGRLTFEMTPFVFGACFEDGISEWTVKPTHVMNNPKPHATLIESYEHTIRVTSPISSGVVGAS